MCGNYTLTSYNPNILLRQSLTGHIQYIIIQIVDLLMAINIIYIENFISKFYVQLGIHSEV